MAYVSEFLFVDPSVDDIETIISGLRPGVEAIVLNRNTPAARQIADALNKHRELDAVHIIAHGAPGRVSFSAGAWSVATLADDAKHIAAIGRALSADGGLRLWSCDAAASTEGAAFIAALAQATGADVAAAAGRIGAVARGGAWHLAPFATRAPAKSPLTAAAMASYAGVLATKTWIGGDGSWATAGNWSPSGFPGSTDDIVIPNGLTNYPQIAGSIDTTISSLSIGTTGTGATASLTFVATVTLTLNGTGTSTGLTNAGTINLADSTITVTSAAGPITNHGTIYFSGGTLSDTNSGITNSGASALVSGSGTLTGAVTNQSGATIAVTSGTMAANSGIDNSALITIASGDYLTSTGTVANSGTITGNNGTLGNGTAGTGTVSNTGTITGAGTISMNVTGSGGTITASGSLFMTGTVAAAGQTFTINSATQSALLFGSTATTAAAIAMTSSNQTLQILATGNLTITTAENITAGQVGADNIDRPALDWWGRPRGSHRPTADA